MTRKTAFVTGASRGIGRAVSSVFHEQGYEVMAPRRDELDLLSDSSIAQFIETYRDAPIDVIVNNAGMTRPALLEDIADSDIHDILTVNLIAPLKLLRGLTGHMKRQRRGWIVNVSSIFGVVSKEKRTVYAASKFGINGITKSLAVELGEHNILINSVCPGYVDTEMTRKNVSDKERAEIERFIPLRRFAGAEEIARIVAFLASDVNTYITGQTIIADGGFTSR